ncbi:DNA sulfur modification protein DndB, partial [Polyangium spumosum]
MTKKKLDQKKSGTQTGPTKERSHGTEAKNNASEWAFPAIRGVQAGGEYYSVMVQLRDVAKLFAPVDGKLPPELRAQRVLSKVRVPKIADYITNNPTNYTLPALVGAIDGLPRFEPAHEKSHMGTLYIPRDMTVAVLDGQHRIYAHTVLQRRDVFARALVQWGWDVSSAAWRGLLLRRSFFGGS